MYDVFLDLLDEKGLKVCDVAKAKGISHPTFTHWKQGATPHFKSMVKIARFLGVSLDVFAEEALKC
ncbi:helix-turn-helix domain-containing protein [Phascolarctobacterium succinatutens]|uniref:helix-turn-helix domain-containing protein n=1 Tax=Phascolarctobacterium succinatutens TaxID=626940 RepID=UPI003AB7B4D9